MKKPSKMATWSFNIIFVLLIILGVFSKSFDITFVLGALIISLLLSLSIYLIANIFYKIKEKNKIIDVSSDLPTIETKSSSIDSKGKGLFFKSIILIITISILAVIIGKPQLSKNEISVKTEALPEINIVRQPPIRVEGIKGVPSSSTINYNSSTFLVTFDNSDANVYRLENNKANVIQGLPNTFYSFKFLPTGKGLAFILRRSQDSESEYYLIKDDKAMKMAAKNYPGELYVNQIIGKGDVKIGMTDTDKEKKLYFIKAGELFNPISIPHIKYPDVVIVNNTVPTNSLIPISYLVSRSGYGNYNFNCDYKIFFINDKDPRLEDVNIEHSNNSIDNICRYEVFDDALWLITKREARGLLWRLEKNKATQITDFALDDATSYDLSGKPQDYKISPEIDIFEGLFMVNTGRNRYLLKDDKLHHMQNIAYGSVSDSGALIAKIGDSLYAGCSDAGFANFRLCQYGLNDNPIIEKYIGTIDKSMISPYKSTYNDEHYILGATELTRTKYFHLTEGRLAQVDRMITTIFDKQPHMTKTQYVDFIKKGMVFRYEAPEGKIFEEYSLGSDDNGSYYTVYNTDQKSNKVSFDGIYYLPNSPR